MSEVNLGTDELGQYFSGYLDSGLVSSDRNTNALSNDVYNLTDTNGQKYVMRILRAQPPESVATEAAMQSLMAQAGIRIPMYLELQSGGYVGSHDGTAYTLSEHIEGEVPKTASLELITSFGSTLARLHDALKGFEVPISETQMFNINNARDRLASYEGPLKERLTNLFISSAGVLALNLPKATIHGDLWLGNVFADGDRVTTVFDLETAENSARIIDLARTYASMRLKTKYPPLQITERLFTGYDSVASDPLTDEERQTFSGSVAYVAGACATWNAIRNTRFAIPQTEIAEEALAA